MARILLIKLGALGDIVQLEGAFHDIRNHHPDAEIIAMTTPPYRRLMELCPWIDTVFLDHRHPRWRLDLMLRLKNQLRQLDVDMVYDLQQVARTHFYHRFLLPDKPWRCKSTHGNAWTTGRRKKCAAEEIGELLKNAGIETKHILKPDLHWMAKDMKGLLDKEEVASPFVVLIPGASSGHDEKRWPHYPRLAAWLREQGQEVVTVPGPAEMELCRSITQAKMLTDGDRYLDIFELAGILSHCQFAIGNDTGPTHIAAHLNLPGLALFSGQTPALHTGIQHSRFSRIETDNLHTLSFEEVREKVHPLLNQPASL